MYKNNVDTYSMKLAIRTILFHLLCVVFFASLYLAMSDSFRSDKPITFTDCLSQSVTIQAGVGFTVMEPFTFASKLAVVLHQLVLISTHVATLYVFT